MKDTIKILESVEWISSAYSLGNGYLMIVPRVDFKFSWKKKPMNEFLTDVKVLYNWRCSDVYLIGEKYYVLIECFFYPNDKMSPIKIREISLYDRICM